jgi:hypothetical protein
VSFRRATETLRQLAEKIAKAANDMTALDAQGAAALRSASQPTGDSSITNVLTGAQ